MRLGRGRLSNSMLSRSDTLPQQANLSRQNIKDITVTRGLISEGVSQGRRFYENTILQSFCPCNAIGHGGEYRTGWGGIRKDPASASRRGRTNRKKTRSGVRLDERFLQMGRQKICMDARQMEAAAARRRRMEIAQVAPRPRRIYIRSGRLALRAPMKRPLRLQSRKPNSTARGTVLIL
jgi:hypothetical protein